MTGALSKLQGTVGNYRYKAQLIKDNPTDEQPDCPGYVSSSDDLVEYVEPLM